MIDPLLLLSKVAILVLMIVPGFLLAKAKLLPDGTGKALSNLILYAAQVALIIAGFCAVDPTREILLRMLAVFLLALITHPLFYLIGQLIFKNAEVAKRKVLVFSTVFTNAGYMGIPLLEALFFDTHPEVAIYGAVYVTAFNVYLWTMGAYLYTEDKQYISAKKVFFNPATIATLVGLAVFALSAIPAAREHLVVPFIRSGDSIVMSLLTAFKGMVAPLSMIIIGLRLTDLKLGKALRDRRLYLALFVNLLVIPAVTFLLLKLVSVLGIYHDELTASVLMISAAAPAATATSMFAEKFDGDGVYAGLIVSLTSILCVVTMPLVCALTKFY